MNKKIIKVVILIISLTSLNYCQYINVRVTDADRIIYGEEMITINPKNPNQMLVGTMGNFGFSPNIMGCYYTANAGLNWTVKGLTSNLAQLGSDPVVFTDTAGNFHYVSCINWLVSPPNLNGLICLTSTNGGANWDNGVIYGQLAPKMDDMPFACVDHSNSQYRNNFYMTWSLYDKYTSNDPNDSAVVAFCRSTDGGITFSTSIRLSEIAGSAAGNSSSPEGPYPCTGVNGEVYVCWPHSGQVYFDRSTNGGLNWLEHDIVAAQQVGGWAGQSYYLLNYSPVIACDLSNSPYRGTIYICFADLRSGTNDRDVWVTRSTNNGNNWDSVVRVNNDSPGHNQILPWLCVDPITGFIYVVFYDGRNYGNYNVDTYLARSTDGGTTFQNVKVSNSPTIGNAWLGDYIGISAYNNKVRPIWTKWINGSRSEVWTAIIDTFLIGIQPVSHEIPVNYSLSQNYPNPFNPTTKIKFDIGPPLNPLLRKEGTITLKIYDILGKEVATLVNESLSPGTYEVEWNASDYPSGVYFYTLQTESFIQTKRMVLVK
jgi:hypothetical protein